MCGALRRVSVARGYDPAAYALVAIGGAGPLHGAELAELLGITTVIVPPQPGLAAAWGLMAADLEEDFMRACTQFDDALDIGWIARTVVALEEEAHSFLVAHAVPPAARVIERHLDLRYRGMLGQLCVPLAGGAVSADTLIQVMQEFHARYRAASGHDHAGREAVEILTVRVRARGLCARPALMPAHPVERAARPARDVFFLGEMAACPSAVWARGALARGTRIVGPAVVEQYESTTLVPPRWSATVDQGGNLILSQAGGARPALAERGRFAHAVT
jgi:N-methylhydantoinase A